MTNEPSKAEIKNRVSADPGEDMNVRHVHAAIWREEAEPAEVLRRTPAVLKHFYFVMFLVLVLYLLNWMGEWNWDEYEASPVERGKRDRARESGVNQKPKP